MFLHCSRLQEYCNAISDSAHLMGAGSRDFANLLAAMGGKKSCSWGEATNNMNTILIQYNSIHFISIPNFEAIIKLCSLFLTSSLKSSLVISSTEVWSSQVLFACTCANISPTKTGGAGEWAARRHESSPASRGNLARDFHGGLTMFLYISLEMKFDVQCYSYS